MILLISVVLDSTCREDTALYEHDGRLVGVRGPDSSHPSTYIRTRPLTTEQCRDNTILLY
jgi:hypothetical protein